MRRGEAPRIVRFCLGALAGVFLLSAVAWGRAQAFQRPPVFGVTFSPLYAKELGVDWKQNYREALEDLGVRHLRIPVYWSELEPKEGVYQWKNLDWMLEEAAKRGAHVTLVIGRKVPRWPECFLPDWTKDLNENQEKEALLSTIQTVVERYKNHPALERWQVENEPFLVFGACPSPDGRLLREEVARVRRLDSHPILLTASGELELWTNLARSADTVGVSLYRDTWQKWIGFGAYPLPPDYYRFKTFLVNVWGKHVMISELQAEPWLSKPYEEMTRKERARAFTADLLRRHVAFARETGISEISLWGAEWWFAEKEQGNPSLWEEAKKVFKAGAE